MSAILPFIMRGGAGARLWPLSREALPKQFHKIGGRDTLFQQTCRRLRGDLFAEPSVVGNRPHRLLICEQMEDLDITPRNVVLEPIARNTGPARAALLAARTAPDSLILLAPSDHSIGDQATFVQAIEAGLGPAQEGALVTFGVQPDCPRTGFRHGRGDPGRHG
jgi:mannose-1-phosphate guanylyltransferase/mannose-6-phosphate isomerase